MTEHPQDTPQQPSPQDTPWQPPPPPPAGHGHRPPPYQMQYQPHYPGPVPLSPGDARMWSVFAHVGGTFLSFLVPLVIYLVFKDRDPFVRRHASQALNFHIAVFIGYVIGFVLILVLVGILVVIAIAIATLVLTILAAVAANNGRDFQYPLTPTFVR